MVPFTLASCSGIGRLCENLIRRMKAEAQRKEDDFAQQHNQKIGTGISGRCRKEWSVEIYFDFASFREVSLIVCFLCLRSMAFSNAH